MRFVGNEANKKIEEIYSILMKYVNNLMFIY
jgi:hypothetical protein